MTGLGQFKERASKGREVRTDIVNVGSQFLTLS